MRKNDITYGKKKKQLKHTSRRHSTTKQLVGTMNISVQKMIFYDYIIYIAHIKVIK